MQASTKYTILISSFICVALTQEIRNSSKTTTGGSTLKNSVQQINIQGEPLETCSLNPLTGFFRDGYCRTADEDHGSHTLCARVTKDFLEFTKSRGNDLSTPRGRSFPGLKPGDYWCLCAVRWLEAFQMGKVTPVKLKATNEKARNVISMDVLEKVDDSFASEVHDEL